MPESISSLTGEKWCKCKRLIVNLLIGWQYRVRETTKTKSWKACISWGFKLASRAEITLWIHYIQVHIRNRANCCWKPDKADKLSQQTILKHLAKSARREPGGCFAGSTFGYQKNVLLYSHTQVQHKVYQYQHLQVGVTEIFWSYMGFECEEVLITTQHLYVWHH